MLTAAGAPKPTLAKEIKRMPNKKTVLAVSTLNPTNQAANPPGHVRESVKHRTSSSGLRPAPLAKSKQAGKRPSPAEDVGENLCCRYCGSGDLAPSFRKRRDARCRACFKQRYATRSQKNNPAAKAQVSAK